MNERTSLRERAPPDAALQSEIFQDVAMHAPAMLWMSDANGAMVFLNQRYLSFTGLTAEQALRSDAWISAVHPADRDRAMSAYLDAFKRQAPFQVEYRLRRADGVFRHMLDIAAPRHDLTGRFRGYVGSTVDFTIQREQEEALSRSTRAIERRSHELNVLYELKADLQVCRTVAETRPVLKRYGRQLFTRNAAAVYLYNNSRNLTEPFVQWGDVTGEPVAFAPDACWALRKGKLHCEHRCDDEGICPNRAGCISGSYLCVPMTAFGETLGVLQLSLVSVPGTPPDGHEENELKRIGTMAADEMAAAIEELKLRARLHAQSIRDPLTKLFNRRYLMDTLEREIARAEQHAGNFCILMLDVDQFKRFNDVYGHAGGDHVLKELSVLLTSATRGSDIASRYGGEEFCLVTLDCPLEGGINRAESIRRQTERLHVLLGGQQLGSVSVSIGVACFPQHGSDPETLLRAADAALYRAKGAGRNCVCVADDEPAAADDGGSDAVRPSV